MNRVIKFRAWDCDNEVMSLTGLNFNNLTDLRDQLDSFESYFGESYFETNPEYLMQFTGLKDKNGVDVFEGDILIIGDNIDTIEVKDVTRLNHIREYTDRSIYIEVIGNIHQNPELIESLNLKP